MKNDYLEILSTSLKNRNISEYKEIVLDYENYFYEKSKENLTYEQICEQLGDVNSLVNSYLTNPTFDLILVNNFEFSKIKIKNCSIHINYSDITNHTIKCASYIDLQIINNTLNIENKLSLFQNLKNKFLRKNSPVFLTLPYSQNIDQLKLKNSQLKAQQIISNNLDFYAVNCSIKVKQITVKDDLNLKLTNTNFENKYITCIKSYFNFKNSNVKSHDITCTKHLDLNIISSNTAIKKLDTNSIFGVIKFSNVSLKHAKYLTNKIKCISSNLKI